MKRVLLLILPILIIVAVVFTLFGIMQVRFEEEKQMDDLARNARNVAESVNLYARHILAAGDLKSAQRLVESFRQRERMQGCVIYDSQGQVLAVTSRIADWGKKEKPYLPGVIASRLSRGSVERFRESSFYSYIMPVLDDEGNILGLVEVVYDTSYMFSILTELWRRISATLIFLILLIAFIAVVIQHRIFVLPVRRLTQWFTHFQRGETDKLRPFVEKGEFGKLVREVEQVALGLRVARRVASDEAHERIRTDELWTEAKLKDLVQARLGENALFVVSNREPYMHVVDEKSGSIKCVRPASGVVTAIDPILRACGGTWIAQGSGDADKKFVNSKNKLGVPPEDNRYILKRVWLTKKEEDGYYYGFSNEGLWPLCHVTHTRPILREVDWQEYKAVNRKFAENVLEELPARDPFVFIQDYHFTLLPQMIKEKRPDAVIALFWHIPWPNPEVFAICPYQQEILDGMLAADLIGFHVQYHCNNFLDTANRLIECRVDTEKFSVVRANKETGVRAFPISVDGFIAPGTPAAEQREVLKIRKELGLEGKIVALGVDRIDYTKGLLERILAVDRFLEKYPEYKERFVFVQLAAPSRTHIKRYHELISEIDELVEKKNWKYSDGSWQPIVYLKRHFSAEEIRPFYALADICIVSSLHDGMNLVAKEYIASRSDETGVLVLSRFTGASKELADAVQINPYSIEEFADAIRFAAEMPLEEKKKRMESMRKVVSENNVYKWAANIITDLTSLKKT
ncbi:MAG: trehalose-6-phosphate synthase [Candidatus Omnitrophica bacterium]|nr:trehalose-6-phosphate synthase [Candidatus Omnitrophota bacterium]